MPYTEKHRRREWIGVGLVTVIAMPCIAMYLVNSKW